MRKYSENTKELEKAVCNFCGKELLVENGILKEGICSVDVTWGYFSKKDTMIHHLICARIVMTGLRLSSLFRRKWKKRRKSDGQACKNLV